MIFNDFWLGGGTVMRYQKGSISRSVGGFFEGTVVCLVGDCAWKDIGICFFLVWFLRGSFSEGGPSSLSRRIFHPSLGQSSRGNGIPTSIARVMLRKSLTYYTKVPPKSMGTQGGQKRVGSDASEASNVCQAGAGFNLVHAALNCLLLHSYEPRTSA